ncbi:MAG: hypothetical protein BWK80_30035 [Desulfobacteraceae bacterium IS3]|nr:MAG: hypothetical protein BWK80_30035 [Desulfobacteraceae bacterium IS3]
MFTLLRVSYQFAFKNCVIRVCFQPRRFSSARLKTDSDLNLFLAGALYDMKDRSLKANWYQMKKKS